MSNIFVMIPFESMENLYVLTEFFKLLAISGDIKAIGVSIAALGVLGTGFSQGFATAKSIEAVSRNPEAEKKIRSLFILGMALTESAAIYALLLGIIIAFVV